MTLFAPSDSKTKAELVSDGLISLAKNTKFREYYKQVTELARGEELYWQLVARKSVIEHYDFLLLSKMYQMVLEDLFDVVYVSMVGLRPLPFAPESSLWAL